MPSVNSFYACLSVNEETSAKVPAGKLLNAGWVNNKILYNRLTEILFTRRRCGSTGRKV